MANRIAASCPHELRPGTTVCLHCRRAEREAASARTRSFFGKVAAGAILLGICGAAGLGGYGYLKENGTGDLQKLIARITPSQASAAIAPSEAEHRPDSSAFVMSLVSSTSPASPTGLILSSGRYDSAAQPAPAAAPSTADLSQSGSPAAQPMSVAQPMSPVAAIGAAPAQPDPPVAAAPLAPSPIVAEGVTSLPDSMVAVRNGDMVTVRFDTERFRTRRPEKFEQIVRATLPQVLGALADSVLAALPAGDLVRHGDLLTELPQRGIRLAGPTGLTLTVWPETRPGRDGPLVVSYRATLTYQH